MGLLAVIGFLSIARGGESTIEIVGNDGRSFRAIPKSLSDGVLVVVRESDKKQFPLATKTLTEETVERAKIAIKTQQEQRELDRKAKLEASRKGLTAYSHRCDFGLLTLYSSVDQCSIDKNGYNSGVTLKAPDRSSFLCYNLSRHKVTTKAHLREHASLKIEERMRSMTQPEREKILKGIEFREVSFEGWSGYEVLPSDLLHSIRSLFLEREGNFFAIHHHGPESVKIYRESPASISRLKINQREFESILTEIKIEQ
jgi:hypothetical protein